MIRADTIPVSRVSDGIAILTMAAVTMATAPALIVADAIHKIKNTHK
ncbi:Uncharacterised protein [Mycobacteroides abscessus subsp. massiliense]|nr:Uncharacterised protein [Mycobacteroides abscessus subsp. massiliense]